MRNESAIEAGGLSDELVGRIYRAGPKRAGEEVAALSAAERANLAAFCYARAHLHEIGLAIAALCDLRELLDAAGTAGSVLYAQSRSHVAASDAAPVTRKRAITLARFAPMRPFTVIEGGLADADEADAETPAEDAPREEVA
jgi:hypothetical protein